MGLLNLFSRKSTAVKAKVKMFRPAPGGKSYGFLELKSGPDVYFNEDVLGRAKIAQLKVGQEVYCEHEPSTKKAGGLQAKSIRLA